MLPIRLQLLHRGRLQHVELEGLRAADEVRRRGRRRAGAGGHLVRRRALQRLQGFERQLVRVALRRRLLPLWRETEGHVWISADEVAALPRCRDGVWHGAKKDSLVGCRPHARPTHGTFMDKPSCMQMHTDDCQDLFLQVSL